MVNVGTVLFPSFINRSIQSSLIYYFFKLLIVFLAVCVSHVGMVDCMNHPTGDKVKFHK